MAIVEECIVSYRKKRRSVSEDEKVDPSAYAAANTQPEFKSPNPTKDVKLTKPEIKQQQLVSEEEKISPDAYAAANTLPGYDSPTSGNESTNASSGDLIFVLFAMLMTLSC